VSQERNTPLTTRSVVASLVLGTRRGQLPGSALVRAGTLFGFAEGTTRVALSRMVAAGELDTDAGQYRLSGPLRERHGRQEEGRRPQLRRWDGTWLMAVVGSSGARRPAAQRASVRKELTALRLAEWREGVWIRPDNIAAATAAVDGCTWLKGVRLVDEGDNVALTASLFAPAQWARTARRLSKALAATRSEDDIPGSVSTAAAVVRHLRDDPLLPDALLPDGWPGDALRAAYDVYEADFGRVLASNIDGWERPAWP
jgi:phenylacetic acid degradation operon negative regulatory protein